MHAVPFRPALAPETNPTTPSRRILDINRRADEAEAQRAEAIEQRTRQESASSSGTRAPEPTGSHRSSRTRHLMDVVSHEVRNPTSAIISSSLLCRDNLQSQSSAFPPRLPCCHLLLRNLTHMSRNYSALRAELQAALEAREGLTPTPALLASIDEDLEALTAISQMGQCFDISRARKSR